MIIDRDSYSTFDVIATDMQNAMCPYRSPPLRVSMEAAFSVMASIKAFSPRRSGLPVTVSMFWAGLGKPAARVATDGAIFMMSDDACR